MDQAVQNVGALSEFPLSVQAWVNDVLVWIGFGTLIGLLAKAIMPGRDPGGAIATLMMGIGGVVVGCGTWSLLSDGQRVTPVSPLGMLIAIAGAFFLLSFYRLLAGYWFLEGEVPPPTARRRRAAHSPGRRRRSPRPLYDYDE